MRRLLAGLILLLGSCSLPAPDINAKIVDGRIVFDAVEANGWWWETSKPVDYTFDRLTVYSREGATWVIERRRDAQCGVRTERTLFPLAYGHVPACFTERLHALPLRPGTLYRVDEGRGGSGIFRISQVVDNPQWDQVQGDLKTWPRATNPDTTYPEPRYEVPGDSNLLSDNVILETPPD